MFAIVEWNGNGYTALATAKTLDSAIVKALNYARATKTGEAGPYRVIKGKTFQAMVMKHANNRFEVSYN